MPPQQTILFRSRDNGYHTYRIPSLAVTAGGTILATCEARKNSPWDDGPTDLVIRRSTDAGETWSDQTVLVAGGSHTAHNSVMIADPASPEIHFLHCIDYARAFHSRSDDAGVTFHPQAELTHVLEQFRTDYNWSLIAIGPGHALRLRTGRLLAPVWMSTHKSQNPTAASIIHSDDDGKHWHRGPIVVRDGDGQGIDNPMEPVLVELHDGSVMMNIRNASPAHRRAVSISPDGVRDWSPLRFDEQLHEPFCMSSICRLSLRPHDAENAILYAGPDDLAHSDQPGTANVGGCDRKRVTVKLSADEGETWPHARVLEPSWSGYSDLAVVDGAGGDKIILCLYESGCVDNMMWDVESIRLARFSERWLRKASGAA